MTALATVPELDVDELCVIAGRTVTLAYRRLDPSAREYDAAHGRIVRRTRLRGTLLATDADVAIILCAAARTDK